jgi:RNA polymerase sigma factor (sigma-70 family)
MLDGRSSTRYGLRRRRRKQQLQEQNKLARFEQMVLPHLNAAYNLARWLTGNETDAEDVVQEACLRAFRFLDGFRGGDCRSWLLTIVRNTCYTWLQQNPSSQLTGISDERAERVEAADSNPEKLLLQKLDDRLIRKAIEDLPVEFREAVILREFESLSYREIADVADVPIGTVMSRLARARRRLQQILSSAKSKEVRA